uniref:Uncharacterized protein n=1 Tax=Anguilla anguilla TaxID=7936 RepID=A0A0E9WJT3_ANGAN
MQPTAGEELASWEGASDWLSCKHVERLQCCGFPYTLHTLGVGRRGQR